MYCHKCGTQLNENAIFCHNCGAAVGAESGADTGMSGAGMSKKDYFKSDFCSSKAKSLVKANRILYWVFVGIVVFVLASAVTIISAISDVIDDDVTVGGFFEKLETITDEDLSVVEEDIAVLEEAADELGVSLGELLETAMSIAIGTLVFVALLIVLFATLAVFKTSNGFAITTLVLVSMYSGSLLIIGCAIAILVITILLNKEYKQKQSGFSPFMGTNGFNEPDFR